MKRYNVLMVLADQHNAGLLGSAGHPQVHTPTFDRFAAEGVRFTNAYSQNTICTPSRVSILSGQYCHNHGYYGLSGPTNEGLDNLFRHFRRNGYRTAGYGKLHLPDSPRNWVADDVDELGDTYESVNGEVGKSAFLSYLEERGLRRYEDSWHNAEEYGPGTISHDAMPSKLPYEHTQERWCADQAMRFMKESGETPFFIQVAFQKPHHPLLPNQQFWDMYPEDIELPPTAHYEPSGRPPHFREAWTRFQNRRWDYGPDGEATEAGAKRAWRGTLACITQIDDVFARLLAFLEENSLAEDTIVIYSSDHGAYHGIHGIEEKAPGICSDAVCRVPMIWRVPGVTGRGSVVEDVVEAIDMAATLPGLCDLDPMECVDGRDISPLLGSGATVEGATVEGATVAPTPSGATRKDDGCRRTAGTGGLAVTENVYAKAIRFRNWRMVYYPEAMFEGREYGELYDLSADPDEKTNLYDDRPEVVREGMRRLTEWLVTTTRVVTTQPAVRLDGTTGRDVGGTRSYPICTDGTAPNWVQPRRRTDTNINYL